MRFPRHPGVAWVSAAGVVLLAACEAAKPQVPALELAAAPDTLRAPFTDAAGAAALGPGRWAVVSEGSGTVAVVDFAARRVTPLGDPKRNQLRNPYAVFRSGDSLWVADWGLRRLTVWGLDGRLGRAIPAPAATGGTLPRARDDAGRFYVALIPPAGRDGSGARDSGAVARTSPDLMRIDTVARLAPLDLAEVRAQAGRRFERRVFSGVDQWGVLPDGSLWVARVYQNRVDWRDPTGRWTRGDALPDRVLEVTRADREVFIRSFPPEIRSTAEQLPFAPIKPPFDAAFSAANGLVWLEKSRSVADSTGAYHVVNREGRLAREVRVRGPVRILAARAGAALGVAPDSGGLRLLQFTVPELLASAAR